MAVKYAIQKNPTAFPAKVLAQTYGEHLYSVEADTDCWNGAIVARGDYKSLDLYEEGTAGAVNLKIVDKAPNGNWYVEVEATVPATQALMVYTVPMIEEEYNSAFKKLENFYIAAGEKMRCYPLHEGDIWELSTSAFTGVAPAIGKAITTITGRKLVVS